MASRLKLHEEFIDILRTKKEKVTRVYFQPPASLRMEYPCIKYSLSGIDIKRADNIAYNRTNQYQVTVIDPDPDSVIPSQLIERFPKIRFDRPYTADNLNHYVFTLYY
jgi:hypothetical protein